MISRRAFIAGCVCGSFGGGALPTRAQTFKRYYCGSSAGLQRSLPSFLPMDQVDFSAFSLADIPGIVEKCCEVTEQDVEFLFSDEIPMHASVYDRLSNTVLVGVGNASYFSFTTLIAVILHELGHAFSFSSALAYAIDGSAKTDSIELIADVLAGAAFAKFQKLRFVVKEAVPSACASTQMDNNSFVDSYPLTNSKASARVRLNPDKISGVTGTGKLMKVAPDGAVVELDSSSVLDSQRNLSPTCKTDLSRRLDFAAVVSAASNWKTFGDLPGGFGHGTAAERYQAFTFGYDQNASGSKSLLEVMVSGCKQYGVRL